MFTASTQLKEGLKQAAVDVNKHISTVLSSQAKAQAKSRTASDNVRLAQHRADFRLRQATAAIKAPSSCEGRADKPIFKLDAPNLFGPVAVVSGNGRVDHTMPFILKGEVLANIVVDAAVQQAMTKFAGYYKRKDSCSQTGRFFELMAPSPAKKVIDEFLQDMNKQQMGVKPLAIQKIVGGFDRAVWQVGYMPTYWSVGLTPNSAAMQRMLVLGTLDVILVNTQELMDAMSAVGVVFEVKASALKDYVMSLDKEMYVALATAGCTFLYVQQAHESLLHVPTGWLMVEWQGGDDPLVYGWRKSLFYDSRSEFDGYSRTIQLMQGDGMDATKMNEVKAAFSTPRSP